MDIGKVNISMEQVLNLLTDFEKFILARWAYSVGKPVMSDAEYTQLLRAMEATMPDNEYVKRSWSSDPCPTELLERIGRKDLITAVIIADKTESIPSLNSDLEIKLELGNVQGSGTASMKHDGWNIQANYFNGHIVNVMTRGRSSDAVDVSKLRDYVPETIPYTGPAKVVMELTVSKSNFKICANLFNNVSSRSAVSTILARPEYYHLLSFTAFAIHGYDLKGRNKFEVLKEWGFNVPMYFDVYSYSDLLSAVKMLSDAESTYEEPTDGVVYDGELTRAIRILAWEEPIYTSYVTGYIEQYGAYRLSPSVSIYPIMRKGTTQRQLSMTNWQRIMDYNLQPGAPVAFRIASSAMADFDEESTRLLHKQWENRWEEFKNNTCQNEEINRCQWQMYLQEE